MSRFRPARVASGLLVALGLVLPAAPGQEPTKPPRKAVPKTAVARQVYAVRGRTAEDLAQVLSLYFRGEQAFQAVPDPASNCILLSGPKSALESAIVVLREIDRPARTVHVEILILNLADGDTKAVDWAEFSGPARDVKAKVRDLQEKGVISSLKTVRLTTLERQVGRSQAGENRPFVTGVAIAGGGFGGRAGGGGARGGGGAFGGGTTTQSISYRSVGTSAKVKPEVGEDEQVTLDVQVEDSRMRPAAGGAATGGTDEKGTAARTPEFTTLTVESRLKVRSGHIVLAEGTQTGSKSGQTQTVVLVSARLDDSNSKDGK
jgi:uncharacterized membrane protein YgcG